MPVYYFEQPETGKQVKIITKKLELIDVSLL